MRMSDPGRVRFRAVRAGVQVRWIRGGAAIVAVAALLLPRPADRVGTGRAGRHRGFDLGAGAAEVLLRGNRVECRLNANDACRAGTWPAEAPERYIFDSGLQIAGMVPADAGFAWAGDTVGAYFADSRGTQFHSELLGEFHDSRAPLALWPPSAQVRPGSPFDPALAGRRAVSDHDVWVRFWDGNPTRLSGRAHPMGVVVEQRAMAWGYPVGNDDIVYYVFDIYNVSASDPAAYVGLDPARRAEFAGLGERFQQGVEDEFGVDLPDGGYRLERVYLGLFVDADIAVPANNFSTAVLPFDVAAAYAWDFEAPSWRFPADIFSDPFARAPGFAGTAFLVTPSGVPAGDPPRLTMFTNFTGASVGFPDPVGVSKLWRYLSGYFDRAAGDNPCTVPDPVASRLCYLSQQAADTRYTQATGPFTLAPGERATVVVAFPFAAPVASAITSSTWIRPGVPPQPDSLALGADTVRTIDRAMGWVTHADRDGNGLISGSEVETVPRSFLNKVQVAQAVVDAGFRLASPPEAPRFHLVPGDGKVTIVWEPSPTESLGDPYSSAASDPTSPLFDPNFRQFDVEGYRIYRGPSPEAMTLIAQFDYDGTTFVDRAGALDYGDCAPELGELTQCPVAFDYPYTSTGPGYTVPLDSTPLVQVRRGDRIRVPGGGVVVLRADTAISGGGSGLPPLRDTGVPFALVDGGVANATRYYYAVTAFDVNAFGSAPSSFESPIHAQSVVPRVQATGVVGPVLTHRVTGDDGEVLDVTARWPRIDPATGTFGGNIPPGAGGRLDLPAPVREALPPGDIVAIVDSVGPGFLEAIGETPVYHTTMVAGEHVIHRSVTFAQPTYLARDARVSSVVAPLVPYDSVLARRLGIVFQDTTTRMPAEFTATAVPLGMTSVGVAVASGRYGVQGLETSRYLAHSRWFAEGSAEPPDPTITAYPDAAHHAGALPGVTRIWSPAAYRVPTAVVSPFLRGFAFGSATAWYPADFVVTWLGGGGVIVRDVTHGVDLPFTAEGGSGWGFLTLANVLATGLDQATWDGIVNEDGVGTPAYDVISYQHLYLTRPTCDGYWSVAEYCVTLAPAAELQPLDFDTDGQADGTGIVLLLNGEPFFFDMASLPAAGTQWHLRAITGIMTADCTPALGPDMTDCDNYTFQPHPARPANVPGQRFVIRVQPPYIVDPNGGADLTRVHTVPDPYYVANALEVDGLPRLRFVHLPPRAVIRIYSVSGVLVALLEHDDPAGGGEAEWDLRSRTGRPVASGVYFYHIETPAGQQHVGRFTILSAGR